MTVMIMANIIAKTTDEPNTVLTVFVIESTEMAMGTFPFSIKNWIAPSTMKVEIPAIAASLLTSFCFVLFRIKEV